jgi:HK97 gp10 family phage protein
VAAELRQRSYATFRITLRNQEALQVNFLHLDADLKREVRQLAQFWGNEITDKAVELAPFGEPGVDPPWHPGFLKENIEVRFSKSGYAFEVGCWAEPFDAIGENLYAIFQEYGTSRHPAQPFLNPAYEWGAPKYTQALQLLLKSMAKEYGAPGSG